MKKIIILISGRLKFFSDKNYKSIKKSFKNFEVNFIITPWIDENENLIKKFKKKYKPLLIRKIYRGKFNNKIKLIRYPDKAASMEGFFYNWEGIKKGLKEILIYCKKNQYYPDYILRYRSDILPKKNSLFLIKKKLKEKQLIIPDRYHWNGINDQIFLIKYETLNNFKNFFNFVDTHIKEDRFFSGEYIFYRFIKKNNFKIIFNNFNYGLMREKNFNKKVISNNSKSIIPIKDSLIIKANKLKYKIRNFSEFFLYKNNRNKHQDIKVN